MKVKLSVSSKHYAEIEKQLTDLGIEIDDDGKFVLSERDAYSDFLAVRDGAGERLHIPVEKIVSIESFGHSVEVHGEDGTYYVSERLYQLCNMLDPVKFIRVSNSAIVARSKIKTIKPSLSMKFVLLMADGNSIDVTRSYYNIFKETIGI